MKHILAILWKQIKDTWKNKEILIQFIMFPVLTLIMENTVKIEGMPEHFFATLFAVMYIGMAPLVVMAAIISEEKEKNTLRVLLLSNVKPWEYLIGVGIYIWLLCMIGAGVIGVAGKYTGADWGMFMLWMGIGMLVSIVLGAAIGTFSKNQMTATSFTVPAMMVFSFLPMLSMFHKGIEKLGQFSYSGQLHKMLQTVGNSTPEYKQIAIVLVNLMAAVILFVIAYRKKGLE